MSAYVLSFTDTPQLIIGLTTNHSNDVVPSPLCVVLRSRPFETSTIGSGTMMAMRWLSGSSESRSLLGHQTLAPSPSSAVDVQRLPRLSCCQMYPPSHGGRFAATGLLR